MLVQLRKASSVGDADDEGALSTARSDLTTLHSAETRSPETMSYQMTPVTSTESLVDLTPTYLTHTFKNSWSCL